MNLLKSKKKAVAQWWAQVLVIDGDFRKSTENVRVQLQVGRPYHWQKELHSTGPCKSRKGKNHNWNVALRVPILNLEQDSLKFQVWAKPYVLLDESLIGEGTIGMKQFQLHNACMARVVCTYQNKDAVTLNIKVTVDDGSGAVQHEEVVETKTTVTHSTSAPQTPAAVPLPGAVVYAAPPPLPPQQVVQTVVQPQYPPGQMQYAPPLPGQPQPQMMATQTTQVQYAPPLPGQPQPQPQYVQQYQQPQYAPTGPSTPQATTTQYAPQPGYPPQQGQPQYQPQQYAPAAPQGQPQYPQATPGQPQQYEQPGYPPAQGQLQYQPQYAPQTGPPTPQATTQYAQAPQNGYPPQGQPQYQQAPPPLPQGQPQYQPQPGYPQGQTQYHQ